MKKIKDGESYYLKTDRRKFLKVLYKDGDDIGVVPSIVYPKLDEKIILPSNQIYWTTEKELLEGGLYVTLQDILPRSKVVITQNKD